MTPDLFSLGRRDGTGRERFLVSLLSSLAWKRRRETPMLASLSKVMAWVMLLFVAVRFVDVAARGELWRAFAFDLYGVMFLSEAALLLAVSFLLLKRERRENPGALLLLAILVAVAGSLYRLDASRIGFPPGSNWSSFPSVVELTITLGFIALAILAYLYAVKRYPFLPAPGAGVKTTS